MSLAIVAELLDRACPPSYFAPFPAATGPAVAFAPCPTICPERLGALLGRVDLVDDTRICGWAQNVRQPDVKVRLEILINGTVVAETLADRYREDLRRAGIGIGEHGFEAVLPPGLLGTGPLTVRRTSDGAIIEGWHQTATHRLWRRAPTAGHAA